RVLDQTRGQQQRQDPDRNVDEENPAPGVVVGNPPAEGGSNRGPHHHRNSVYGKSHSTFGGREGIRENGLLTRLQTAAADSLQNPENNEGGKVGRKTAQKGTHGEQGDAAHIKALAAHNRRQPPAERQNDRIRDEIRSQNPGALVLSRGKSACDVRQGDVGDARVEHFHESRKRNRQRDDPGI